MKEGIPMAADATKFDIQIRKDRAQITGDVFDYGDVRWISGGSLDRLWLIVNGFLCFITPWRRLLRVRDLVEL